MLRGNKSSYSVFSDRVDGLALKRVRRLHPGFRQGWMRVNSLSKLTSGEFGTDGGGSFRDQISSVRANSMGSKKLFGFGIGHPLHKSYRLTNCQCLT